MSFQLPLASQEMAMSKTSRCEIDFKHIFFTHSIKKKKNTELKQGVNTHQRKLPNLHASGGQLKQDGLSEHMDVGRKQFSKQSA